MKKLIKQLLQEEVGIKDEKVKKYFTGKKIDLKGFYSNYLHRQIEELKFHVKEVEVDRKPANNPAAAFKFYIEFISGAVKHNDTEIIPLFRKDDHFTVLAVLDEWFTQTLTKYFSEEMKNGSRVYTMFVKGNHQTEKERDEKIKNHFIGKTMNLNGLVLEGEAVDSQNNRTLTDFKFLVKHLNIETEGRAPVTQERLLNSYKTYQFYVNFNGGSMEVLRSDEEDKNIYLDMSVGPYKSFCQEIITQYLKKTLREVFNVKTDRQTFVEVIFM